MPAVCPARLHALLSRTKTCLSAVFNGLWYAAQRTSSYGRKALAKQKIRRKLGDYGQLWAARCPPNFSRNRADHIVSRQRPPYPLQLELADWLDLYGVLDLH